MTKTATKTAKLTARDIQDLLAAVGKTSEDPVHGVLLSELSGQQRAPGSSGAAAGGSTVARGTAPVLGEPERSAATGGSDPSADLDFAPPTQQERLNAYKLAQERAQKSAAERLALTVCPTKPPVEPGMPPFPPLDGDLPLKWEVYNMLVSGWSPESVRVHFAKLRVDVPISQIADFRETIPEQDFLPYSGMTERFKGRSVRVDPVDELHKVLMAMRERANAALLLEEIEGYPDKLTTELLDKYAGALTRAAALQQSMGEIPGKSVGEPGSGQGGGGGAPTIQVLMQTILMSRPKSEEDPDHPVLPGAVVEGVIVRELPSGAGGPNGSESE